MTLEDCGVYYFPDTLCFLHWKPPFFSWHSKYSEERPPPWICSSENYIKAPAKWGEGGFPVLSLISSGGLSHDVYGATVSYDLASWHTTRAGSETEHQRSTRTPCQRQLCLTWWQCRRIRGCKDGLILQGPWHTYIVKRDRSSTAKQWGKWWNIL